MSRNRLAAGFTLIELMVVIAILGLLIAILAPALSRARKQAKATLCLTRLRTIGQGLVLYADENDGVLVPGRMPGVDDEHWQVEIAGGLKYRRLQPIGMIVIALTPMNPVFANVGGIE